MLTKEQRSNFLTALNEEFGNNGISFEYTNQTISSTGSSIYIECLVKDSFFKAMVSLKLDKYDEFINRVKEISVDHLGFTPEKINSNNTRDILFFSV